MCILLNIIVRLYVASVYSFYRNIRRRNYVSALRVFRRIV